MDIEMLARHIRESLASVVTPRFFETERGFQGALLAELHKRIPTHVLKDAIIEQEYQKSLKNHGLTIRPDIVIHEPFDPSRHIDRREGNIAVIALKLNASRAEAAEDFRNLAAMIGVLHYPLGVFVNIASNATHCQLVPPGAKGHILSFAVSLDKRHVHVLEERI